MPIRSKMVKQLHNSMEKWPKLTVKRQKQFVTYIWIYICSELHMHETPLE